MTISELIAKLQAIQEVRGDLPVFVYDDERMTWNQPVFTCVMSCLPKQQRRYKEPATRFLEIGNREWIPIG